MRGSQSVNSVGDVSFVFQAADFKAIAARYRDPDPTQRYTYRVLQTIQMKLILLCVGAEPAVLGSTKSALKFKYEI